MSQSPFWSARLWGAGTALLGAGIAARPVAIVRWAAGGEQTPPTWVVRVLGLRQLLQGIAVGMRPTRAVIGIGVAVDLSHAVTMAAACRLLPRYRHSAILSGTVAAASAVAGIMAFTGRTR